MLTPSKPSRFVQLSEEVQKPVQAAVMLGNDCIIVTQQDKREIRDTRMITYHTLGPNGNLLPINLPPTQEVFLKNSVNSTESAGQQNPPISNEFFEVLKKCCGALQPVPQQLPQLNAISPVTQQMDWETAKQFPPNPFSGQQQSQDTCSPKVTDANTKGTSIDCMQKSNKCPCCQRYCIQHGPMLISTSCNTDHEECKCGQETRPNIKQMLKDRKIASDHFGIYG